MIRSLFSLLLIGALGFGGWIIGADKLLWEQLESRENRRSAPDWMRNRAAQRGGREDWSERVPQPQAFKSHRQPQRIMRRPLTPNDAQRRQRIRRFRLRRQ